MKRDWDARARENAKFYVVSSRSDWDEEAFSASGKSSAEELVFSELDLVTAGDDPRSLRLLEIGCGVGRMTEHLAETFGEVHGVDVSGEMVATAKQRLSHFDNVHVHETNGADLAVFPDSFFDFAFSFIVFQHIPFREVVEGYLREVHRVLKPGRLFKFQVQGTSGEKFAALEKDTWLGVGFSAAEMDALAAEIGFEVLKSEGEGTQYFWHWWRAGEAQTDPTHRPSA
ncbi:MAG TPA: class I SAM-dependent methyltransferase [Thermoleophilaceae bacterium]|nr:class I SAM-dependent methyltransferase [Thermoleophilaceae bacterium]